MLEERSWREGRLKMQITVLAKRRAKMEMEGEEKDIVTESEVTFRSNYLYCM